MKTKRIIFFAAVLLMAGCEKAPMEEMEEGVVAVAETDGPTKRFTFTVKGDFGAATFTRGYLQADGQDMTDLWVFDFMGTTCVQTLHQGSTDADFGKPTLALAYGSHHVYFVASRGEEPVVDADGHTIVWGSPRDTFWKDYAVEVVSTSNGNRAVTLDRVATKLRVVVADEVPTGCATVTVTPDRWYYGLDYMTGDAVSAQKKERSVTVPATFAGTIGQLAASFFGLSAADEWATNITIQAKDGSGSVIGSAVISGAPFKANRCTEYSGSLFASGGSADVSLAGTWEGAKTGTW